MRFIFGTMHCAKISLSCFEFFGSFSSVLINLFLSFLLATCVAARLEPLFRAFSFSSF